MAFIVDKEELKPGLIIFRRSDVGHRNWYCRVKLPNADRYKTISLKVPDVTTARQEAWRREVKIHALLESGVPVFNRPFSQVAVEWLAVQQARADRGEISPLRPKKIKAVIDGALAAYVGSTQVTLIGQESWEGYPAWRRNHGVGRNERNGMRNPNADELKLAEREKRKAERVARISDATIRFEMSIFGAVMAYAIRKKYASISGKFENRPKLKIMRRDEFTVEEYRKLHTTGRAWVAKATKPSSVWYRTVAYNFVLIMCNTGMRPSEAKNLRWRDITPAKDREGREIVVLFVQGKGKTRKLVAPKSVSDYLERIRSIAKAMGSDEPVFTTITGEPAKSLYQAMIEDLLTEAGLRKGPNGIDRSTYCFRHSYATFRLHEGVDVYFLAEQMGTSVKMIEDHYGHVNTIKHADRVLQGMGGWDPVEAPADTTEADAKAAKGAATRLAAQEPKPKTPTARKARSSKR